MAKFLRWIVNMILLCSIAVAGVLLIPPLAGVTTVMVDEVDMDTNLEKGDVAYAKKVSLEELEVGDQVLVHEAGDYVYRVKSIDSSDGTCKLEDTRTPNSEEITKSFKSTVEKIIIVAPFIGYIPMAMKSTEGLIVIGLVVVFVVILFILSELWRPDEDEEEEEEAEAGRPVAPERPPIPVDVSSIIMEEVSNEIASAVSSVVAEEQMENDKEYTVERSILNYDDSYDEEEIAEETEIAETETAETETAEEEIDVKESEKTLEETEVAEEEMEGERELAMPIYTAQELIIKAKEKGEEPEIVQDENTGVTILDYSNLL